MEEEKNSAEGNIMYYMCMFRGPSASQFLVWPSSLSSAVTFPSFSVFVTFMVIIMVNVMVTVMVIVTRLFLGVGFYWLWFVFRFRVLEYLSHDCHHHQHHHHYHSCNLLRPDHHCQSAWIGAAQDGSGIIKGGTPEKIKRSIGRQVHQKQFCCLEFVISFYTKPQPFRFHVHQNQFCLSKFIISFFTQPQPIGFHVHQKQFGSLEFIIYFYTRLQPYWVLLVWTGNLLFSLDLTWLGVVYIKISSAYCQISVSFPFKR